MSVLPVKFRPGPKVLAACLNLAGFSSDVVLPAITDAAGMTWSKPSELQVALAVAGAESSGHVYAYHANTDGSTDFGFMEINDKAHPQWFGVISLATQMNWAIPVDNAMMAYQVYTATKAEGKNGFSPWVAYESGGYKAVRYQNHSWLYWASYGIAAMAAEVLSLVVAGKTRLAALQYVASVDNDPLVIT